MRPATAIVIVILLILIGVAGIIQAWNLLNPPTTSLPLPP